MEKGLGPEYASAEDAGFTVKYHASCYCNAVQFEFGFPPKVPKTFLPTCHIFYASRVIDINDDLPKWSGHKNQSERVF